MGLAGANHFYCKGNILSDLKSEFPFIADIFPRQHKISEVDKYDTHTTCVTAQGSNIFGDSFTLYKPIGLSVPIHKDFCSLLASLSSKCENGYLVTRVVQCTLEKWGESTHHITLNCKYT